jgi:hypothetical protein
VDAFIRLERARAGTRDVTYPGAEDAVRMLSTVCALAHAEGASAHQDRMLALINEAEGLVPAACEGIDADMESYHLVELAQAALAIGARDKANALVDRALTYGNSAPYNTPPLADVLVKLGRFDDIPTVVAAAGTWWGGVEAVVTLAPAREPRTVTPDVEHLRQLVRNLVHRSRAVGYPGQRAIAPVEQADVLRPHEGGDGCRVARDNAPLQPLHEGAFPCERQVHRGLAVVTRHNRCMPGLHQKAEEWQEVYHERLIGLRYASPRITTDEPFHPAVAAAAFATPQVLAAIGGTDTPLARSLARNGIIHICQGRRHHVRSCRTFRDGKKEQCCKNVSEEGVHGALCWLGK